jgi:leucyl/phenylalanyl-tRNA--protein transferase
MTSGISSAPFLLNRDKPTAFPNVEMAMTDPNGLLAIGGDLSIERLVAAYQKGIFPWYNEGQPIIWWSPNPRAVLFPEKIKISKSLRKSLRKKSYQVTFDRAFVDVINACAVSRRDGLGTWIVDDMKQAYIALHQQGLAHSVEVWQDGTLTGGLYGVSLGMAFFGESMFSKQTDTSKIALVYLARQVQLWEFGFIDCQVYSEHLGTLGCEEIPRSRFIQLLDTCCGKENLQKTRQGSWNCTVTRDSLFNNER